MKRIRLGNTVFEGLNNVYVLDDGDETALVDTGVALPEVRAELADGLAEHGLTVADVDEVLLTHWHYDHAGLAGEIQAESGATVRVHEADAPLVAGDPDAVAAERERLRERFDDWAIPPEPRAELEAFLERHADLAGDPADVTPFGDDERFAVAGETLEAVHLPGHAAGLTAYERRDADGEDSENGEGGATGAEGREAFVGDVVLPKYTPNVGGADVRVEAPLARYAESLVRVVERDWARALPGHRDPIDEPAARAVTILDHHRERTGRVVDVLDDHGPCDAWTVSAHLFGDLADIHILHGPGEAFAHLDHLADRGVVERDGREYELVAPAADVDVDALFPTVDVPE